MIRNEAYIFFIRTEVILPCVHSQNNSAVEEIRSTNFNKNFDVDKLNVGDSQVPTAHICGSILMYVNLYSKWDITGVNKRTYVYLLLDSNMMVQKKEVF